MKKLLLLALLAMAATSGWAEKADAYKQAIINFDAADVDEVNQTRVFTGFTLERGTLKLASDKAVLKESPEGYMFVTLTAAPGKVATFRQKRDGGADLWFEGEAERIEYDDKSGMVKLFARAKVRQIDGPKKTNEIDSEFISYDSHSEQLVVRNDASGQNKPGKGRGTLIIAPRLSEPPPATPPAPGKQ